MNDLRYAFRQLLKNPGFTAVAVLTLGLGIGAATAMFGLIQEVLLSPPPYAEPDRLVLVSPARIDGQPYQHGCTIGQWLEWRKASQALQAPALYSWTFNFLVLPDGSESLGGMVVTKEFFSVLGIKAMLGHEFTESEIAAPNAPPSTILGAIIAVSLGRVLEAFLFETKPADPVTLGGVALLFAAVALLACYFPARRATQVDPMEALRCE